MRNGFGIKKTPHGWHTFIVKDGEIIMAGITEYSDKRLAVSAICNIADVVEDSSVEDAENILAFISEYDANGVFVEEFARVRRNKDAI